MKILPVPLVAILLLLAGCAAYPSDDQVTTSNSSTTLDWENEIRSQCEQEWTDYRGNPDWSSISLCVDRQWDGYRKLHS